MTKRTENLLRQLKERTYRDRRIAADAFAKPDNQPESVSRSFRQAALTEPPVLMEDDRLGFHRGTRAAGYFLSGNITVNYGRALTDGLERAAAQIRASMAQTAASDRLTFGRAMLDGIDVMYLVADKYRNYAVQQGCVELAQALERIPRKGAESFYQACVFMNLMIYSLRLYGCIHLTLGRFDQYMYPFFQADRARGVSEDDLFELVEEFFISLNYDSDLYPGIQQGDNGQSMVLGGFDKDGNSMYNSLSQMCMEASLELKLIDPKINLRVGHRTPDSLYEFATRLTREGLGFPQYCNDDIVVPGLVNLGYDYEDALNYTVAACWEYIVPNCGGDVPNLAVMDFPAVVRKAMVDHLQSCDTFEELLKEVEAGIKAACDEIVGAPPDSWGKSWPNPLLSVFVDGCREKLADAFTGGARYNNFGSHGAGIANATDALAAVKKTVYEDRTVSKTDLLDALANNFVGKNELRNLLCECPKMGNNEPWVDELSCFLMDVFARNLNGRPNFRGGIWRAGTGSAMEYIFKGAKCPATADGRKAGEPYSSSFSPSINARTDGLLSVIQSFTRFDLKRIINGGPLTIEVHDTVLRNEIGIQKTAMLVKAFIDAGGHQLQINSVNREQLLDAQKHPEKYPNLIVRVWGWSGYFNELDLPYQNHIIARTEYAV